MFPNHKLVCPEHPITKFEVKVGTDIADYIRGRLAWDDGNTRKFILQTAWRRRKVFQRLVDSILDPKIKEAFKKDMFSGDRPFMGVN